MKTSAKFVRILEQVKTLGCVSGFHWFALEFSHDDNDDGGDDDDDGDDNDDGGDDDDDDNDDNDDDGHDNDGHDDW